jgi:DNA replication licensing factor MCM7
MADQVPVGHIPRSLTIHCHGAQTRQLNPGDVVDIAGIFLPTPYTGFRAIRAGLLTDTYLEAQHITQHKKSYNDIGMDSRTLRKIDQHMKSGQMYEYLSRSIAPEIFGHLDVKKALLLLLIGGVSKEMGDGMHIRGDINICLMGDPGVAKSQLLRYITKVAPRGVYTTGRGSSGVGLTAAVMRDPVTDEMMLEGGALVLADNGICCIDEFDKMEDSDRTAIHEVMEQQTISISKAGINTTLNARTSILAAANPLYGRYNPRISPVENINLPAALLSRFDVMFLLLDTPTPEGDEELAAHVTYVHMHNKHPENEDAGVMFTPHEVRQYIAKARTFRPVVPSNVSDYMVGAYVAMRKRQKKDEANKKQFSHVTPRTLLGIVRLSQALARLRFSEEVVREDVDEALRLIEVSKASLSNDGESGADYTPSSKIYKLIGTLRESGAAAMGDGDDSEMSVRRIRERVLAKGFTDDQLTTTLQEYADLGVSLCPFLSMYRNVTNYSFIGLAYYWRGLAPHVCRGRRRDGRLIKISFHIIFFLSSPVFYCVSSDASVEPVESWSLGVQVSLRGREPVFVLCLVDQKIIKTKFNLLYHSLFRLLIILAKKIIIDIRSYVPSSTSLWLYPSTSPGHPFKY